MIFPEEEMKFFSDIVGIGEVGTISTMLELLC